MTAAAGVARSKVWGDVYFVRCHDRPIVKIGWASNVQRRLSALQAANPDLLVLLGTVEGTMQDELAWHREFAHLAIRNEWFTLADELQFAIDDRVNVTERLWEKRRSPSWVELDHIDRAILRGEQRRREASPRGTAISSSKLDEMKVRAILLDKRTMRAIAADYGVGTMTVHAIKSRRTWTHVPDPRRARAAAA